MHSFIFHSAEYSRERRQCSQTECNRLHNGGACRPRHETHWSGRHEEVREREEEATTRKKEAEESPKEARARGIIDKGGQLVKQI